MYKLICLDLDGTLLGSKSKLSERNRDALIQCLNNEQQVYLVTGRPVCFSHWIARQIDPRIQIICCNGAWYQLSDQLIRHEISDATIASIQAILQRFPSVHAFFKGEHHIYTSSAYDPRFFYDHINPDLPDSQRTLSHFSLSPSILLQKAKCILKVLVYDEDPNVMSDLRTQIERLGGVHVMGYCNISFDIVAQSVDKSIAIRKVCAQHNIPMEQVLAIGDGENDLQMLKQAGLGIAMGNASISLQTQADLIAPSNDEDGVAWALQHYALGKT